MEHSNTPTLEHLNTWTIEHYNTWTLEHYNTWTVEHLNTWTLEHKPYEVFYLSPPHHPPPPPLQNLLRSTMRGASPMVRRLLTNDEMTLIKNIRAKQSGYRRWEDTYDTFRETYKVTDILDHKDLQLKHRNTKSKTIKKKKRSTERGDCINRPKLQ